MNGHLPPRMVLRHEAYYWTPRVDGRQIMRHLGKAYAGALSAYYELEEVPNADRKIWRLPAKETARNWKQRMFLQKQASARRQGIEFSLTFEELTQIVKAADGKCQITKIPFEVRFSEGERRRLWAPSLDRIDPSKGYTLDNCRLVCIAVNIAMSDWGIDVLLKIGRALKEQRLI